MTRALATLVALAAATMLASCGGKAGPDAFGGEIVMSASMPAEVVERFNAFVPEPVKPGANAIDVLGASTEKWLAPTRLRVTPRQNPYAVAIRVRGRVTGDDGAVTLWLGGFERDEKAGGGPYTMTKPIAGINAPKGGTSGDGRFERAAAVGGTSFRDEEDVRAVVELQRRAGLNIEAVDVEVWSGFSRPTWTQMLLGWQGALVGVFMLVFWWFLLRKRD